MVTQPSGKRLLQKEQVLHNIEHALSKWTPDDYHFTNIMTVLSCSADVFACCDPCFISVRLLIWMEHHIGPWDHYSNCSETNSSQNALSLVCWCDTTDSHALDVSDDTVCRQQTHTHTRILPSPFMALYRTSASALELKFPLAFTVPLLACNMEELDKELFRCSACLVF